MSVSAPDLARVDAQMATLEHLVVIDPFLSEATRVTPTSSCPARRAEEEGTITTIEGRVVRCDQAVAPLARRSRHRRAAQPCPAPRRGDHFDFTAAARCSPRCGGCRPAARTTTPGSPGAGPRRRVLAVPDEEHPGTPHLYLDRSPTPTGGPVRPRGVLPATGLVNRVVSVRADDGPPAGAVPVGQPDQRIPAQQEKAPGPTSSCTRRPQSIGDTPRTESYSPVVKGDRSCPGSQTAATTPTPCSCRITRANATCWSAPTRSPSARFPGSSTRRSISPRWAEIAQRFSSTIEQLSDLITIGVRPQS